MRTDESYSHELTRLADRIKLLPYRDIMTLGRLFQEHRGDGYSMNEQKFAELVVHVAEIISPGEPLRTDNNVPF